MEKAVIIGIAGGSGSGKTTLAQKLKEIFGDDVVIMSHDFYYRDNSHLPFAERARLNYDHPDAFETDLMVEDLTRLQNGQTIYHPVYSFVEHTRTGETVEVTPARVILLEGILLFENPQLRSLMDIKVFVDTDADVRLARRLVRDVAERGRDLNSVVTQYLTTVKPMHEQFVEPSKKYADIIIPEGGHNIVALSMLVEKIRSYLPPQTNRG